MKTSPIILTTLKLKDAPLDKNDKPVHGINVEAIKHSDTEYAIYFGAPKAKIFGVFIKTDKTHISDAISMAAQQYKATIADGEVARLQKLLA